MRGVRGIRCRLLVALVLFGLASVAAWPKQRLARSFTEREGLPVNSVSSLAQDSRGFLWIGTTGGLVRYDGVEMRVWAREILSGEVARLAAGPNGRLVAARRWPDRGLYEVLADGARRLPGPDEPTMTDASAVLFDAAGRLWVVRRGVVLGENPDGSWSTLPATAFDDEQAIHLAKREDGGLWVVTDAGVWERRHDGTTAKVFEGGNAVDVVEAADGALILALFDGTFLELRGSETRTLLHLADRSMDLVRRRNTVWATTARNLVALRPGQQPEVLGREDGFGGGGPLLVDGEGSLWTGSFVGLFQFPEPETRIWTEQDGLPGNHTRFLTRTGDALWIATWMGLGRLNLADGVTAAVAEAETGFISRDRVCADGAGRVWTLASVAEGTASAHHELVEGTMGSWIRHPWPAQTLFDCRERDDGSVWIARGGELLLVRPGEDEPLVMGRIHDDSQRRTGLAETPDGELWAAIRPDEICHAPFGDPGRTGFPHEWNCERLDGAGSIYDLEPTPSGRLWLATENAGVLQRSPSGWTPVVPPADLPSPSILGLSRSRRGGLWIAGHGSILRVQESEGSWTVLESPSTWNGLPSASAQDVLETADGTLWLTTSSGVVQVPPDARRERPFAPRVELVDVRVDGSRLPISGKIELPYSRNRVELYFAALSYRAPRQIRYRVRLADDDEWAESGQPQFRFVNLRPGDYRAQVIASLDGMTWSPEPATLAFVVLRPWYLEPWFLVLAVALAAASIYAVYRTRLALLLRLERQRSRIAMDLHDEMGSGLGSIGILADLASEETVPASERSRISRMIAETAGELATSLGDIVWSLRGESATLEALAAHLADRGGRMFPGDRPEFRTRFPEPWPRVELSLAVRRNLQRIGIEALHNAAKHSAANRVELAFGRVGRGWSLAVRDDGEGIERPTPEGTQGLGLESMRVRAAEIGAEFRCSTPDGGGTRVEVTFEPRAEALRSGRRAKKVRPQRG